MIRVSALYRRVGKNSKFECFCITIGSTVYESPIGYLRMSEMKALEGLLKKTYYLGKKEMGDYLFGHFKCPKCKNAALEIGDSEEAWFRCIVCEHRFPPEAALDKTPSDSAITNVGTA